MNTLHDHIINLIPLAAAWVAEQENFILTNGVPLTEDQQIDAFLIGVKDPAKVRLFSIDEIPLPAAPELKTALKAAGFLNNGSIGLSLRYGIYVQSQHWNSRRLVVHELTHTMHYERLGGIDPFLRQYVEECLTVGYSASPLEREAREMEKKVCGGSAK